MSLHSCNKYCDLGKGHEIQRDLNVDFTDEKDREYVKDLIEYLVGILED